MTTHVLAARPRGRRALTAFAVAAALAVAAVVAVNAGSGTDATLVTAKFADASPLVPGNKVQMNGFQVGTIDAITRVGDGADVVLALDEAALPLHSDASARIEPVSLLGERFIALDRGSESAPVMSGAMVIPRERTSAAVDVDDVISTLDRSASTGLAALVGTLGQGIAHQGDSVARSLETMPATLRQFDKVSKLLDEQNLVLNKLVVSAEKNATAFAGPLDSLVDATQRTLGVVSANRQSLDAGLVQLPGTLSEARGTLTELSGTAGNTARVLAEVRPLTDNLVDTSRELRGFAEAAQPALESLPEVLDKADRMLDDARPIVRELGPAADRLRSTSRSVRSLNKDLIAHPAGVPSSLENLFTFMADWAMSASAYDGISHYFKFKLLVTPSSTLTTAAGALPPLAKGERDLLNPSPPNPNGPDPSSTRPFLPFVPGLPNPDGPDNSSHTAPKSGRTGGSGAVSGLTPKQENNMFGQLLGGG